MVGLVGTNVGSAVVGDSVYFKVILNFLILEYFWDISLSKQQNLNYPKLYFPVSIILNFRIIMLKHWLVRRLDLMWWEFWLGSPTARGSLPYSQAVSGSGH